MRIFYTLVLMLGVQSIVFGTQSVVPEWYSAETFKSIKRDIYFGYGSDEKIELAKQNALEDVAKQITTHVKVNTSSSMKVQGEHFTEEYRKDASISTDVEISDYNLIKSEYRDGINYVVIKYVKRSLSQKIKEGLDGACEAVDQNQYLSFTHLIKQLNDNLGCKINYKVARRDNQWALETGSVNVEIDDAQIEYLYANTRTESLRMSLEYQRFISGDEIVVSIYSPFDGYVSLFNVYGSGKVSIIEENIRLTSGMEMIYPSGNDGTTLEATVSNGERSVEMFVALYSDKKKNYSPYRLASTFNNDESFYMFDRLIGDLEKDRFASVVFQVESD